MYPIVVIAASEGGLVPLRRIVKDLPTPCAAAVLVVSHIGSHQSVLPSLLAWCTSLSVRFAEDGEQIQPGRVYVAPPDRHMIIEGNRIALNEGPKVHFTRPAADPLFISAAKKSDHAVMGIVLSGGDGDGAVGLRIIKESGGRALVQRPGEAENPEMPFSALLADHPDEALSAKLLAERVRQFCTP